MSFFNMGNSRQSARAELPPKTRHLPAAAPGHVVGRDRLPDRAPAPHGPDSLRSSTTDAVLAPPVSANAVIDSLDNVPQHSAVLTAGDSRSVMRLPREIERFLCALGTQLQRTEESLNFAWQPHYAARVAGSQNSRMLGHVVEAVDNCICRDRRR